MFEDLLALLREPGEDGVPDTIYDDLTIAYTDGVGVRDAKIEELNVKIQAAEAEISRLKSLNFDLLTALPTEPAGSEGEPDGESDPDGDENITTDDLFEDKE